MQLPTLTNTRLRSTADAHAIIHAARTGLLRMVDRRLDTQERAGIQVGNIYVWEERGSLDLSGMGIERWTDGIRWGPSRLRNDFLYYQQREDLPKDKHARSQQNRRPTLEPYENAACGRVDELDRMIKQTYSVHVYDGQQHTSSPLKLHIIAYFNRRMVENLQTIDADPLFHSLVLLPGMYRSARVGKTKNGEPATDDTTTTSEGSPESPEISHRQPNTLPPIMVAGRPPMLSSSYSDFANRSPTTPYYFSNRESPSPSFRRYSTSSSRSGHYGHPYWGHQELPPDTDALCRTPLPSLRAALPSSAWSPIQRYAEDDMQLARLDVARGLV
ncbi:hypothetical protein M408DRAFT_325383 [Serendipita vermifera MAFF 305830]|uniref:cAMP-independent regulatory protein pac2 n=1 Tax=Serendipita vermifera MAFF 305830 TaxID=933852 RepID=A0A0C3BAE4_SERVB|nr:hypothetical protein M408DRAFT_325383 [Serendipita vermifera MAFF 305830]